MMNGEIPITAYTFGNPQFVYAWKSVPTDKIPKGKREDKSLREKVKEIQKDLDDGIDPVGKKMTVCQLYEKHIRNRAKVRHSTKQGRKQLFFPEHGYVHSGKPDFEYYYEGDMDSKDYKMELWVPITKA